MLMLILFLLCAAVCCHGFLLDRKFSILKDKHGQLSRAYVDTLREMAFQNDRAVFFSTLCVHVSCKTADTPYPTYADGEMMLPGDQVHFSFRGKKHLGTVDVLLNNLGEVDARCPLAVVYGKKGRIVNPLKTTELTLMRHNDNLSEAILRAEEKICGNI